LIREQLKPILLLAASRSFSNEDCRYLGERKRCCSSIINRVDDITQRLL